MKYIILINASTKEETSQLIKFCRWFKNKNKLLAIKTEKEVLNLK